MLRALQGGCKVPITVTSSFSPASSLSVSSSETAHRLFMQGGVLSVDGSQSAHATSTAVVKLPPAGLSVDDESAKPAVQVRWKARSLVDP